MKLFLRFIVGQNHTTSSWKRTSANGLLKDDNINANQKIEVPNNSKSDARESSSVERSSNGHSSKGPQFSTFFRVIE